MGFDYEKALKAVKKENNQSKLREIAEDATFADIRLLAAAKLDD